MTVNPKFKLWSMFSIYWAEELHNAVFKLSFFWNVQVCSQMLNKCTRRICSPRQLWNDWSTQMCSGFWILDIETHGVIVRGRGESGLSGMCEKNTKMRIYNMGFIWMIVIEICMRIWPRKNDILIHQCSVMYFCVWYCLIKKCHSCFFWWKSVFLPFSQKKHNYLY